MSTLASHKQGKVPDIQFKNAFDLLTLLVCMSSFNNYRIQVYVYAFEGGRWGLSYEVHERGVQLYQCFGQYSGSPVELMTKKLRLEKFCLEVNAVGGSGVLHVTSVFVGVCGGGRLRGTKVCVLQVI